MGVFSLFRGRSSSKKAEVEALNKGPTKQRIDIVKLTFNDGQKGVGLKVVAKSLLSYQSLPVSLDQEQARELADQILQIIDEQEKQEE